MFTPEEKLLVLLCSNKYSHREGDFFVTPMSPLYASMLFYQCTCVVTRIIPGKYLHLGKTSSLEKVDISTFLNFPNEMLESVECTGSHGSHKYMVTSMILKR